MQFRYPNGIPTVEQAMRQGVATLLRSGHPLADPMVDRAIDAVSRETLTEIRQILTGEMSTLFDVEGMAIDWNEAIERAIQVVEGTLV